MIEKIENASATELRQWWIKIPKSIYQSESLSRDNPDHQRLVYDEIAYAIIEKDKEYVSFLMGFAASNDPNKRCAALFFLSCSEDCPIEIQEHILSASRSKNTYLRGTALQCFLHLKYYPLTKEELANITDEWLAAWAMSYRCAAFPQEKIALLTSSLKSKNPYIRSFACDIIGDQFIEHMKPLLKPLLKDRDPSVASAAGYNYHEVLE